MTDRENIVSALHALSGADVALYSYAEYGHRHDLDSATDAAKRLVAALEREQEQRNKKRVNP